MRIIKIIIVLFLFISCKDQVINKNIDVYRFDEYLRSLDSDLIKDEVFNKKTSTGDFYLFYFKNMVGLDMFDMHDNDLDSFFSYSFFLDLNMEINNLFNDFSSFDEDLDDAFGRFLYYFPDKKTPKLFITVNGMNSYSMITYGDTMICGLDMYLGKESKIYDYHHEYLRSRFQQRFLVIDALENWCNFQFNQYNNSQNFLDQLIFKGKITYVLTKLFPYRSLEDILRFDDDQMSWCETYEKNIWEETLKLDYLYSINQADYRDFFFDAPFVRGMPKESTGRLGYWIGYRIISSYIEESNSNLIDLIKNQDSQIILLQSKYKP